MKGLKIIERILMLLILISIIVLAWKPISKAFTTQKIDGQRFITVSWKEFVEDYFCVQAGTQLGSEGNWDNNNLKLVAETEITSDDTGMNGKARELAYILYEGSNRYGNRGSSYGYYTDLDNGVYRAGPVQYALWLWLRDNPPLSNPKEWIFGEYTFQQGNVRLDRKYDSSEGLELYEEAKRSSSVLYSNDTANIELEKDSFVMNGTKGAFSIEKVTGSVTEIKVKFSNNTIETISEKNDNQKVGLYSDKDCTKRISSLSELSGEPKTIFIKGTSAISSIKFKVECKGGYKVKLELYKNKIEWQQDLMKASVEEVKPEPKEIEYKPTETGALKIVKKNKKNKDTLYKSSEDEKELNAQFMIYAKIDSKTEGWLCGFLDSEKKYVDYATAMSEVGKTLTRYSAGKTINKLADGTYYIYEVQAPDGCNLKVQQGYHGENCEEGIKFASSTGGYSDLYNKKSYDWVYNGYVKIKDNEVTEVKGLEKQAIGNVVKVYNQTPSFELIKKDSKNGNDLQGAEFKIFADIEDNTNENDGWVVTTTKDSVMGYIYTIDGKDIITIDDQKVVYNRATKFGEKQQISRFKDGTYYIYETKAPKGYNLSDQEYYLGEDENGELVDELNIYDEEHYLKNKGNNLILSQLNNPLNAIPTPECDEWVYCGSITFKTDSKTGITTVSNRTKNIAVENESNMDFDITIKNQTGSLIINKVDKNTKVNLNSKNAQFMLYADLDNENLEDGWLCKAREDSDITVCSGFNIAKNHTGENERKLGIFNTGKTITHLSNGKYYIYEIKAPDGYTLDEQEGYLIDKEEGKDIPGVNDIKSYNENNLNDKVEWVYCGFVEINNKNNDLGEVKTNEFGVTIQYKGEDEKDAIATVPNGKGDIIEPTSLMIEKIREDDEAKIEGGEFKIYAEGKGWLQGDYEKEKIYNINAEKTSTEKATSYTSYKEIKELEKGTYYVFETVAPEGYKLEDQVVKTPPDGIPYPIKEDAAETPVYIGSINIDPDEKDIQSVGYKMTVSNRKITNLQITKVDADTKGYLKGGKFKIYVEGKGWVQGETLKEKTYNINAENKDNPSLGKATEYPSFTKIIGLKKGTYYVFETAAPDGYKLKDQEAKTPPDGIPSPVKENSAEEEPIYVGSIEIDPYNEKVDQSVGYEITIANKQSSKPVEIEGFVWEEGLEGKEIAKTNHIYDNGEATLEGITVLLKDQNNNEIKRETTDANGHYSFTQKDNGEDIYYSDLEGSYVEFIYDNKTTYDEEECDDGLRKKSTVNKWGYIIVDPFVGNDSSKNSKAKEVYINQDKLNDEKLTGIGDPYPGQATVKDLKNYYNERDGKIENINLGLRKQIDPEFYVRETLSKVVIEVDGKQPNNYNWNQYTTDYVGEKSKWVPSVCKELSNNNSSFKVYGTKVYPTDLGDYVDIKDKIKAYVYYDIQIENNEVENKPDLYEEVRLQIESLVNHYDKDRYELCEQDGWEKEEEGRAKYTGDEFKEGILRGSLNAKTVSIKFEIKEDALSSIINLKENLPMEKVPTVAVAKGYHEYLRTDNTWDSQAIAHNGTTIEEQEGIVNKAKTDAKASLYSARQYYLHRSVSKEYAGSDVFLKIDIGKPNKIVISGVVFEDLLTEDSINNKTNLGNGIKDDNERNGVIGVTVQLLKADTLAVAGAIKTNIGGWYSFENINPGCYYIRFIYGDGNQYINIGRSERIQVKTNDYRSTIINTGGQTYIKDAKELSNETINEYIQALNDVNNPRYSEAKEALEWYNKLGSENYSIAVDELTDEKYYYSDGIAEGRAWFDGKEYSENYENEEYPAIYATSPIISIPDKEDVEYTGFNFGIIKQPETKIDIEKVITKVDFTTSVGTMLVSTNPTKKVKYVSDLDGLDLENGSKYVKLEMESNYIYNANLIATYEIAIKNDSVKDYIEYQGTSGHYYKYGYGEYLRQKQVYVTEVIDELDSKYTNVKTNDGKEITTTETSNDNTSIKIKKVNKNDNTLVITGWDGVEPEGTVTTSYKAETTLSTLMNDKMYENKVKVKRIRLDELSALRTGFIWTEDETLLTVIPPTGKDNNSIYWVAGAIGLVVIAIGIIVIKKKVLE